MKKYLSCMLLLIVMFFVGSSSVYANLKEYELTSVYYEDYNKFINSFIGDDFFEDYLRIEDNYDCDDPSKYAEKESLQKFAVCFLEYEKNVADRTTIVDAYRIFLTYYIENESDKAYESYKKNDFFRNESEFLDQFNITLRNLINSYINDKESVRLINEAYDLYNEQNSDNKDPNVFVEKIIELYEDKLNSIINGFYSFKENSNEKWVNSYFSRSKYFINRPGYMKAINDIETSSLNDVACYRNGNCFPVCSYGSFMVQDRSAGNEGYYSGTRNFEAVIYSISHILYHTDYQEFIFHSIVDNNVWDDIWKHTSSFDYLANGINFFEYGINEGIFKMDLDSSIITDFVSNGICPELTFVDMENEDGGVCFGTLEQCNSNEMQTVYELDVYKEGYMEKFYDWQEKLKEFDYLINGYDFTKPDTDIKSLSDDELNNLCTSFRNTSLEFNYDDIAKEISNGMFNGSNINLLKDWPGLGEIITEKYTSNLRIIVYRCAEMDPQNSYQASKDYYEERLKSGVDISEVVNDIHKGFNLDTKVGTCTLYLGTVTKDREFKNFPEWTPADYIDFLYEMVSVLLIIGLIVITIFDLVKSIATENNEVQKIFILAVKRLVVLIIILLAPTLIELIGKLFGMTDMLCGIGLG